jgi:hypothetical protein
MAWVSAYGFGLFIRQRRICLLAINKHNIYFIPCKMRIQEQGIGAWKIEGDFRAGVFGNPRPLFQKGGKNAFML